jgi:hypothetical protein
VWPTHGLSGSEGQGDGPERSSLLPVQLYLPIRVNAANVDDAGGAVDVAAFERQPFLRAQAHQSDKDRQRTESASTRPLGSGSRSTCR